MGKWLNWCMQTITLYICRPLCWWLTLLHCLDETNTFDYLFSVQREVLTGNLLKYSTTRRHVNVFMLSRVLYSPTKRHAGSTHLWCNKYPLVNPAVRNGWLIPQAFGEGKVVREMKWAPPSQKGGPRKLRLLPNNLKEVIGDNLCLTTQLSWKCWLDCVTVLS